jgi:hypothetical protein
MARGVADAAISSRSGAGPPQSRSTKDDRATAAAAASTRSKVSSGSEIAVFIGRRA